MSFESYIMGKIAFERMLLELARIEEEMEDEKDEEE